ncbi:hypothetical protein PQR66_11260 [Paraburkholderia agricolaris]|uniref:Golvesin/Xly CBD-like domain-containing protein n=1 Tax=Paraburkholderia agricolaris TaxID=2152888 RepID=A0ABW8ZL13_9BURK
MSSITTWAAPLRAALRLLLTISVFWIGQASFGVAQADVIVDNTGATVTGNWTSSSFAPNYYGSDYLYSTAGGTSASVVWRPSLPSAGRYNVYYYLPNGGSDRTTAANFQINYQGGVKSYSVNEQVAGGQWLLLDTLDFAAGTTGFVTLTNQGGQGYVIADAVKFAPASVFSITNNAKQTILGLGVELQTDSIGSGNNGLPPQVEGIPHDLIASERVRLYKDMLSGFRYARLAMGLFYRGLSADQKTIGPRYASQNADLAELINQSGMEGVAAEYWSPAPGWKTNNNYINGGKLKQFDAGFLGQFGDNVVAELNQLKNAGIPVVMWGLQNEPIYSTPYSSCTYSDQEYYQTFKVVAPKVRAAFPNALIHVNSLDGQDELVSSRTGPGPIASDPSTLSYVDAWTWHRIGTNSSELINNPMFTGSASGKAVFNNEFEYLDGQTSSARLINTANSIMNWMTFENSPTWFWLHALKPSRDTVAMGYGLGVWRVPADSDYTKWPNVQPGYWDYIPTNYNAVAGFLAHMPWNSVRYEVTESSVDPLRRVMAWKTPAGKLVFAVTNSIGSEMGYRINLPSARLFTGYAYDSTPRNQTQADGTGQYQGKTLGIKSGNVLDIRIPDQTIQFWVEN